MAIVIDVIFPVFGLVLLGFVIATRMRFDGETLANLALLITAPALIFSSLAKMEFHPRLWLEVMGGTCFVAAITGSLGYLCTRRNPNTWRGVVLTTAFWNAGNLPLPLCRLAFGAEGLQIATMVFVTMGTLHAIAGIWIAKGRDGGVEVLKVPLLYASVLGITVAAFEISIPRALMEPIEMLAQMAIPLMLLSLGIQLRTLVISDLKLALGASLLRVLGGILAGFAYVTLFKMDGLPRKVLLMNSLMPAAVINYVIAKRYGAAPAVVASTVVVSTLLAAMAIPALLWTLN